MRRKIKIKKIDNIVTLSEFTEIKLPRGYPRFVSMKL